MHANLYLYKGYLAYLAKKQLLLALTVTLTVTLLLLETGQYLWEYGTGKFGTGPPVILILLRMVRMVSETNTYRT